jgi:regulator of replication initiation timing
MSKKPKTEKVVRIAPPIRTKINSENSRLGRIFRFFLKSVLFCGICGLMLFAGRTFFPIGKPPDYRNWVTLEQYAKVTGTLKRTQQTSLPQTEFEKLQRENANLKRELANSVAKTQTKSQEEAWNKIFEEQRDTIEKLRKEIAAAQEKKENPATIEELEKELDALTEENYRLRARVYQLQSTLSRLQGKQVE